VVHLTLISGCESILISKIGRLHSGNGFTIR